MMSQCKTGLTSKVKTFSLPIFVHCNLDVIALDVIRVPNHYHLQIFRFFDHTPGQVFIVSNETGSQYLQDSYCLSRPKSR